MTNLSDLGTDDPPIRDEVLHPEKLRQHAAGLAATQRAALAGRAFDIADHVARNGAALKAAYLGVSRALRDERAVTPAARWLVDNFHIVEEQIADISETLPPSFCRRLMRLQDGPLAGAPRVYALAQAFVAHTDSQFDAGQLRNFIDAYQAVTPLTMGELWAQPVMLRIVLLDNLRRIAGRVARALAARAEADAYAEAQADAATHSSLRIPGGDQQHTFLLQLTHRLQRLGPDAAASLQELNRLMHTQGIMLDELAQSEHALQGANNLTVRNIITSLRAIAAFDWRSFFEDVSLVERRLRQHAGYAGMDFLTRDRYRHSIEELAAGARRSEIEVAEAACQRADSGNPAHLDRLGDLLISHGRQGFEDELGFRPGLRRSLRRLYVRHATASYFLVIAAVTGLTLWAAMALGLRGSVSWAGMLVLGACALFPAAEFTIGLFNGILIRIFPPRHQPRLSLDDGIPDDRRTLVAMPVILTGPSDVQHYVAQLEVHALANPGANLFFALLSDWADAEVALGAADQSLLQSARAGIAALNERHGRADADALFHVFHRRRLWNAGEGRWMGWERKRGKLAELNRLLRGASDTSFIPDETGMLVVPARVRYVVTLDADTRVPIGGVTKLVGTAAHPLNQPRFDEHSNRVVQGYGMLQPRVTPMLPVREERSFYREIITGASGLDPYAGAVSDVYQDVFGAGIFTGKGLYDVDVFERALAQRVPENAVLSHDLFEGLYARCALVSDAQFFEEFPSHSEVAAARSHRWTRGDWQLLPWLLGRRGRDLPALARWQLLDNLRRSLSPPAALATLIAACAVAGARPLVWLALVALPLVFPALLSCLDRLAHKPGGSSWLDHLWLRLADLAFDLGRTAVSIALLAQNAWLMLDAIGRALWRLLVSHRLMLQWTPAAQAKAKARYSLAAFAWPLRSSSIVVIGSTLILLLTHPPGLRQAAPLLLLWWLAPLLARALSLPRRIADADETIAAADAQALRRIARRTWSFFETHVSAEDHWLPPDNFQEDPEPVLAHRSSPTNFGLYLLATVAARDLGFIGLCDMQQRLRNTLDSLAKLERCNGHLFNWYDTRRLTPLEPRYVSTVDSGNLAGHLLALKQACLEALRAPLLPAPSIAGGSLVGFPGALATLELIEQTLPEKATGSGVVTVAELRHVLQRLRSDLLQPESTTLRTILQQLDDAVVGAAELADLARAWSAERHEAASDAGIELLRHTEALLRDLQSLQRDRVMLLPWMYCALPAGLGERVAGLLPDALVTGLAELPQACLLAAGGLADVIPGDTDVPADWSSAVALLREDLRHAGAACAELAAALSAIVRECEQGVAQMRFEFLFDRSRNLFSIGYRVRDAQLDASYYDLLASEARLASLIAIAKGDAPSSHWFRLGRRLAASSGGPVLLSWSGSMFEYLMPSLVMRSPRDSLLEQTSRLIVRRQIEYGDERGVPWGISESAFNVRDREFTYQYADFGVPGLGLKRGLRANLVISPYSTALAAMFAPGAAAANFQRLAQAGALGRYGYYEALDFTESRLPSDEKVAVVRCYMAHHQGMSLIALCNTLLDAPMQRRFHAEPIVQAAELFLQEQSARMLSVPRLVREDAPRAETLEPAPDLERRFPTAATLVPATHLLSNRHYSVMLTAAGSGYSSCDGRSLTRWREDLTQDNWGTYFFLRNVDDGRIWSAAYQPTCVAADRYEAVFSEDRVTYLRQDGALTTGMEIVVSSQDNVELRRLALTNDADRPCDIDVTSYAEIVLAPPGADIAHPAFSNLFVQTEWIPELQCLLAMRRPRSSEEKPVWAAHLLARSSGQPTAVEYETDRMRFLGRGRSVRDAVAITGGRPLSNTVGAVLDPIVAIRARVPVPVGVTVQLVFATLYAGSRAQAIALAEKYSTVGSFERVATVCWTCARADLYHLGIDPAEARMFQALAGHLLFANAELRLDSELLAANAASAAQLWRFGISGDRPILVLRCESSDDRDFAQQLLRAQEYWRSKRLIVDIVVLNERASSYVQDLQHELEETVRAGQPALLESDEERGGVFILRRDQLSAAECVLVLSAARVVLRAGQGSLAEQLLRPVPAIRSDPGEMARPDRVNLPTLDLPRAEFFNGLGGFIEDGREYLIVQERLQSTPAPWVNVIANAVIGCIASEAGSLCTWSLNSRENQLTPWSNDPVSDRSGEAFFLRDEDSGAVWSPTAQPIRLPNARYLTRHGQGYSRYQLCAAEIETDLHVFVAEQDAVKLCWLQVTNHSRRSRRLDVTAYAEWQLGDSRARNALHVATEMDPRTGAMLVRNPWNIEFGSRVAFADLGGRQQRYTASRREFIGRNGSLAAPRGLQPGVLLSGRVGAGLDPCCAMQASIEIESGATAALCFVIGQAADAEAARELILRYRNAMPGDVLREVKLRWQRLLDIVQVRTPMRALDLLVNRWLPYQTLSCRFWARAGFYQAGGAYGFRDQLQDCLMLMLYTPQLAREHLLRAGARQFPEGDVQHWWHPPSGRGVRTHFSDDRIWLPYVTVHYLDVTGDTGVLDEQLPFITGMALRPDQEDAHFQPLQSEETASLYEHCARTLDLSLGTGAHGLPLIGAGDWNDGMNRVGHGGKGESVWLAWFLITVLRRFAPVAVARAEQERAAKWRSHADRLLAAVESEAWDGSWYRRAFFDDGTPLGSAANAECRIDSIAQSWAVISGAGDAQRAQRAMQAVKQYLVRPEDDLVLLFTPPFDRSPLDPGYIKGYLPGLRENGGQYTHAAVWSLIAYAMLGEREQAGEIFEMLNPIQRTATRTGMAAYKVEPYAIAADVYSEWPHARRGGWTWYTGAAGWMYRAAVEWMLGVRVRFERIEFEPCVPVAWRRFDVRLRLPDGQGRSADTDYLISVENSGGSGRVLRVELDGVALEGASVPVLADGKPHAVRVLLG